MITSASKRLLLRPSPKTDESFLGFILRLAEFNDCDTPAWIIREAGLGDIRDNHGLVFNETGDFSALVKLTGIDVGNLEYLRYPSDKNPNITLKRLFYGWSVPQYVIRPTQPKVCPQCMREESYCRKIWELAVVTACPTHRCLLLDKCPNCEKTISWSRKRISSCPCDYDWRDLKISPVGERELQISRQVHLLCGLSARKSGSQQLLERTPLSTIGLEDLICAIYFIARRLLKGNAASLSSLLNKNVELHSLLHKVFCVFEDWPHNYFSFLDWIKEQRNKDGIGKGLKRDFNPYRQGLYSPLNLDKLSFLREAFEEYIVTRWKGGYVSSIRTLSAAALRNKHYASPSEVMETLKISHERFEYLVEKGTLQAEVSHRKDCKIILVDVSSLRRFKRLYNDAKSLKDVAVLLGIPYDMAVDLVSRKLLTPIFDPRVDACNKWKFSRKELNNLANKIKKRIKQIDDLHGRSFISFKVVLGKFSYFKLGLGQLVSAICDGKLNGYCIKDGAKLSSLLYSRDEVTSYLRAQRQKCTGETFDAYELSQHWGVTKDVAYFLVKKGLLLRQEIVHEGFIDLLVTKVELERFESTYILGPKLARHLNVCCRFLVDLLSARDIHPISGRKVDGGPIYIFKRSELMEVNVEAIISQARDQSANKYYPPKLLNLEQVAAVLDVSKEELQDLVERGIVKPFTSRKHQITKFSEQCFNSSVVERVKKRAFNYTGLISKQVAAAMLGETVRDFFDKYIYTGRLKRVRAEGERNTYYLHLEDVKAHVRLKQKLDGFKNKVMNSPEVAAIFGVRTSCVIAWTASGKLKAVSGPRIDGMPHYLYLKRDVTKLLKKSHA